MSSIVTYTGKFFDPINPDPDKFDVRDMAHALSYTCRGNGQVQKFFSVGQHCILCCKEAKARGYSDRVVLACLLHDASESYMSDVPRPFKETLASYVKQEEYIIDLIYEKYIGSTLTAKEAALVKEVDDDLLYYDMTVLLRLEPTREEPDLHVEIDYNFVPFEEVEKEYLDLFNQYSCKLDKFQENG